MSLDVLGVTLEKPLSANLLTELEGRFHDRVFPVTETGCWIWVGALNDRGYGTMKFYRKVLKAHRISWYIHRGPIPKATLEAGHQGTVVMHKCDVPCCVNPRHLRLGTQTENTADRTKKGRSAMGEGHGVSKLKQDAVREILRSPLSSVVLADQFGVSVSTICRIRSGKLWAHVSPGVPRRRQLSSSGITGVYWCEETNKWRARIQVNGKKIGLGSFARIEDAAAARKAAEVKYVFHANHGRCVG